MNIIKHLLLKICTAIRRHVHVFVSAKNCFVNAKPYMDPYIFESFEHGMGFKPNNKPSIGKFKKISGIIIFEFSVIKI